jgi:hypothetical protein
MASVSEMQAWLADLQRARATGARRVKFGDRETEYKSDAEMAAAEADLERRIAAATARPIARMYINTSKGL